MNIKLDTKEKFKAILLEEPELTANMSAALEQVFEEARSHAPFNIVFDMSKVRAIDPAAAEHLLGQQQRSYEMQHSFVVCCLDAAVEQWLDEREILEMLNVTPTESEAWDIVQMEEIERELLD